MACNEQPPNKKRKLDLTVTQEPDSKEDEPDDPFLDLLLSRDPEELLGSKCISDKVLERLFTKLEVLQQLILCRLANPPTLTLLDRLEKSVVCTLAYIGDGDGNTDYESHCKSEGGFLIGPNKKEIGFFFSAMEDDCQSIQEGFVSLGDVWSVEDIEEGTPMELYFSREKPNN